MNRQLRWGICLLVMMISVKGYAQIGGRYAYSFLKLPPSARVTALGGKHISVSDDDVAFALLNPATLNPSMSKSLTFQNDFHFDGIYSGYVAYAHHFEGSAITGHAGMHFMQYGDFTRADEFGNVIGDFKASEMALTVGAAQSFGEMFSAGVNLRFIYSNYDAYTSTAIASDIGGGYWNDDSKLGIGLVIRNVGFQLSKFDDIAEVPPLDIQIGISKQLKHLPFRFTVTAHTLNQWDLRYDSVHDDDQTSIIGEESNEPSDFSKGIDNLFRHLVFGGEFLLGKTEVVKLRFGYNHQLRQEMSVGSLRSFAGFSLGIGIRIKQFSIDYGFGSYHIAGSTQHIGISTNLSRFKPEKGLLE